MYRFHAVAIALLLCFHGPAAAENEESKTKPAQEAVVAAQYGPSPDRKTAKAGKPRKLAHKAGRTAPGARSTAGARLDAIRIQPRNFEPGVFNPFFGDFFHSTGQESFFVTAANLAALHDPAGHNADPSATNKTSAHETGNETSCASGASCTPFAYRYAMDKKSSVNAGVSWISNLGDPPGMAGGMEEPGGEGLPANRLSGMNFSLGASYKAVTFTGGYIRALDTRSSTELALEGKENDPVAWSSELAYSTELLRRETTLAVGYQKSSDALHTYLPEERYRTRASMVLAGSTLFSLEYYQDRDFTARNGEEAGYGITTKIGFDF